MVKDDRGQPVTPAFSESATECLISLTCNPHHGHSTLAGNNQPWTPTLDHRRSTHMHFQTMTTTSAGGWTQSASSFHVFREILAQNQTKLACMWKANLTVDKRSLPLNRFATASAHAKSFACLFCMDACMVWRSTKPPQQAPALAPLLLVPPNILGGLGF